MSDDIKLNVGSDLARSLGCNDLTTGKKFTLLPETDTNMLSYSVPDSGLPVPIKIKTDGRFCHLDYSATYMRLKSGCNIMKSTHGYESTFNQECENLVNKFYAVNKAYVDRIKYKTDTGKIANIAMTDHIFFPFPSAKAFASGKIIICEIWVERLADEWIAI